MGVKVKTVVTKCAFCAAIIDDPKRQIYCSPNCRWLAYADSLTWQKTQLDYASWSAFLRAGSLGVESEKAYAEVSRRIQDAGDHPKKGKLIRQLRRAFEYAGTHVGDFNPVTPKRSKPAYEPEILEQVAKNLDLRITSDWLAQVSPITPWNRSPAGFLHKLYQPGEKVVVFNIFESQGCEIWVHPGLAGNLAILDRLQKGQFGVWFMANPVDGQFHWNPREQKRSRRSEESVTSWKYLVIESDRAPKDLWLKALVQLPLPIAAIYESGGKSIHALVRVDAQSKEEWDAIVRGRLLPILVALGACDGSLTAVRLTRLPNCHRGETGNLQALLYLNPDPDYTPIVQRPVREFQEAGMAYVT